MALELKLYLLIQIISISIQKIKRKKIDYHRIIKKLVIKANHWIQLINQHRNYLNLKSQWSIQNQMFQGVSLSNLQNITEVISKELLDKIERNQVQLKLILNQCANSKSDIICKNSKGMESLFKQDENANWQSQIINFMKSHRHLTVRQCIVFYIKKLKDNQWRDYQEMENRLRAQTSHLIEEVEKQRTGRN